MCSHIFVEKTVEYYKSKTFTQMKRIVYQCVFCLKKCSETYEYLAINEVNLKGNKVLLKHKQKFGGDP